LDSAIVGKQKRSHVILKTQALVCQCLIPVKWAVGTRYCRQDLPDAVPEVAEAVPEAAKAVPEDRHNRDTLRHQILAANQVLVAGSILDV
jgi:hypothetical protein